MAQIIDREQPLGKREFILCGRMYSMNLQRYAPIVADNSVNTGDILKDVESSVWYDYDIQVVIIIYSVTFTGRHKLSCYHFYTRV